KPRMTPDAFVRHYTAVADASPVPVLLYNYPALTGVNLAPDVVATLAAHPNIAGIKETGADTAQVAAYVDQAPGSFSVIAGSAPPCRASGRFREARRTVAPRARPESCLRPCPAGAGLASPQSPRSGDGGDPGRPSRQAGGDVPGGRGSLQLCGVGYGHGRDG